MGRLLGLPERSDAHVVPHGLQWGLAGSIRDRSPNTQDADVGNHCAADSLGPAWIHPSVVDGPDAVLRFFDRIRSGVGGNSNLRHGEHWAGEVLLVLGSR